MQWIQSVPLHDEAIFLVLVLLLELVRIPLSHLPYQLFEDVVYVPILLGRSFIERQFPPCYELLDRVARHFALVVLRKHAC